ARAPRPLPDLGVGHVVLDGRQLLGLRVLRPDALGPAEVRDPGLRGDAGPGERDDPARRGDPAPDGVDDPVSGLHYWGTSHPADLSTASGLWPPSLTHRGKGGVGFPNLSHAFTSASPVAGRARRACHPPGG